MAQDVTISMDDDLRTRMEEVCSDIGLSMSAAFLIFAKRVARERKIPFELSAARGIVQLNAGKGVRHELIAEDA